MAASPRVFRLQRLPGAGSHPAGARRRPRRHRPVGHGRRRLAPGQRVAAGAHRAGAGPGGLEVHRGGPRFPNRLRRQPGHAGGPGRPPGAHLFGRAQPRLDNRRVPAGPRARARVEFYPHCRRRAPSPALLGGWTGRAIVVSDAVFSMDGDRAPVDELAQACADHDALLVLDEAHSVLRPHVGPFPCEVATGGHPVKNAGEPGRFRGRRPGDDRAAGQPCPPLHFHHRPRRPPTPPRPRPRWRSCVPPKGRHWSNA